MASDSVDINSGEFVFELKKHVLNGNKECLTAMIDNANFKDSLQTDSLDLIKTICQLLNENKTGRKSDFIECCEFVISVVTENSYPAEILLELIEQIESADDDTFLMLVKPVQQVLLRIPEKQNQSLEWVLNTLHRFIYSLSLPEDYKFEEDEQLLLDDDSSFITIRCVYEVILDFYEPFMAKAVTLKSTKDTELEHTLLQSLIHLLGRPVTCLDLTVHKSKSVFRNYVEKIITCIVSLDGDKLVYNSMCKYAEKQNLENLQVERDKDDHFVNCDMSFLDFLFCDKFPNDALGVFYYMAFFENIESLNIPCVYNAEFLFEKCLYFALVLIETPHSSAQFKGVLLAEALVNRINDNSITFEALEVPIHKMFFETLSKHVVYNEVEKIRKMCVTIISVCFKKYDCKSKYIILFNLQKSINHSGLLGYFITFIKDIVVVMLNSHLDLYVHYFSGKNLFDLMKKYCRLPDGVESDLVNTADTIISSLNLIRFLVLRDKENISGIWNYINEIEEFLFKPLRQGLTLSRSHYALKLKEIKEKSPRADTVNKKMSVTVGKEQLGMMSREQQISVINSALNAFDLIESILSRVNECISLRNN